MSSWRRSRAWRELRPYAGLAFFVAGYALLRVVFDHVVGSRGVLTPAGAPGTGLVAFAVVMLVTRIAVLVLVPLILTYRVVRRLMVRGTPAADDRSERAQRPASQG